MVVDLVSNLGGMQSSIAIAVAVVLVVAVIRTTDWPLSLGSSDETHIVGNSPDPDLCSAADPGAIVAERGVEEPPERIARKRDQFPRAIEFQDPTDFINTDPFGLADYVGQRVILIEFWTFGCYNCDNTHPEIQRLWRHYREDGLLIVGVHYPEFDRERDPTNVRAYVTETETTYPVVLDNNGGTWDAYDQRYWPTRYLIGIDGFVRYVHAGEGKYDETERAIRGLLEERNLVFDG